MFTVYILRSVTTDKYYVGCTNDIIYRIKRHNYGLVRWTSRYVPWELIYTEEYKTLSEARKRETQIKSWHKRAEIEKLIKNSTI